MYYKNNIAGEQSTNLPHRTVIESMTGIARPVDTTKVAKSFALPWRYTSKSTSRDIRLDLLRGFCIFVMAIDHIGVFGPDTWLYAVTGKGDFYLSAAEGFVFISGLVMGLVYFKLIAREGLSSVVPKVLARVVKLYWLAVGLALFFIGLAQFTPLKIWAQRDWITITDPTELVVNVLTLHYGYHGSSILVMYIMFIALTPALFYFLSKGQTRQVLAVSWLVWLGNYLYPSAFTMPFAANFPLASWQALFVTGLVIGWHREKFAGLLKSNWRKVYYAAIAGTAIFMLAVYLLRLNGGLADAFPLLNEKIVWQEISNKGALPPLRMALIFIYLQAFYLLLTFCWKPLFKLVGWYFIPVGEKALYSYTIHLMVIVLVYNVPGFTELPYFFYGFAQLGAMGLILLAVKTQFLAKIIPA